MTESIERESDSTIARVFQARRFVQILTPLAEFFGIDRPTDDLANSRFTFAQSVADQAEIAVLNDEHSLAGAVARIDERFKSTGLDHDNHEDVIAHVRKELIEVERAFDDFGMSGDDEATRHEALTEIGDAMLLLARLAARLGATPLEPLRLAVRKTTARLRQFDMLSGGGTEHEPETVWRMAKHLASIK